MSLRVRVHVLSALDSINRRTEPIDALFAYDRPNVSRVTVSLINIDMRIRTRSATILCSESLEKMKRHQNRARNTAGIVATKTNYSKVS